MMSAGWSAGLRLQSGKHDIRDRVIDYQLLTRDKRWSLWGKRVFNGWLIDANAMYETLDLTGDGPSRWGISVAGQRTLSLGRAGAGFAAVALNPESDAPKDAKVLSKPFHLRDLVNEVEKMLAA